MNQWGKEKQFDEVKNRKKRINSKLRGKIIPNEEPRKSEITRWRVQPAHLFCAALQTAVTFKEVKRGGA